MNQVNQLYTYVQIPLQLSGQNANGELYVYTNGKKRIDPDSDVTAFLHLDMENLGSTDVSVRMHGKQVKTNFYLTDDTSYDLVEKNLPVLERRLSEKGYNCTLTMSRDTKPKTFAEQVIGADRDARERGIVHRYSFDVRA
jgi:flagellar hook-length control protein FliK